MRDARRRKTLHVSTRSIPVTPPLTPDSRFQDVEDDSTVELETTEDNTREQNNNSMFQQNLENHQENAMVNSR
jgi:hypothetical protein